METRQLEEDGWAMRVLGNVLCGLTLFVGVVIPLANIRDLPVWAIVPILFAIPIAYLLYSPDQFYRRHRTLITSIGAAVLAIGLGTVGYFIALCFNPSLNPDLTYSLGAAMVVLAAMVVSVLLLADGAVLLIRRRKSKAEHQRQERAIIAPLGGRALDSEVSIIFRAKMSRFCRRRTKKEIRVDRPEGLSLQE